MTTITCSTPRNGIREVLGSLVNDICKMSGTALAKELKLPAPTINRILSGHVGDPRTSTLLLIANYFNITVDQLLGNSPLPEKYVTQVNNDLEPKAALNLFCLEEGFKELSKNDSQRWFYWRTNRGAKCSNNFALQISSTKYSPEFAQHTVLIVNPELIASDGDYIIIENEVNKNLSVKKYMVDGDDVYLLPVGPSLKIVQLEANKHQIIGIVQEAHLSLKHVK